MLWHYASVFACASFEYPCSVGHATHMADGRSSLPSCREATIVRDRRYHHSSCCWHRHSIRGDTAAGYLSTAQQTQHGRATREWKEGPFLATHRPVKGSPHRPACQLVVARRTAPAGPYTTLKAHRDTVSCGTMASKLGYAGAG